VRAARTSCGVIVGNAECILLGHATRSPRWDIPKGEAEPGEDFAAAAARELYEETGLTVAPNALTALGVHNYLRGKNLALFAWTPPAMPDPKALVCSSTFSLPSGAMLPEFDRFGLFSWEEALGRVGKNMARILAVIGRDGLKGASD
jgi:8-oxo-dGTP pyrophosphatase MutT (NUDIX family)